MPTAMRHAATILVFLTLSCMALVTSSCGGGSSAEGAGRGIVLLAFNLDSVDNAALNQRLEFQFSGDVDPATITNASIQIREGPSFGATAAGAFRVLGATVLFEPRLPALCDLSDSGLKPNTTYRVQLIGFPEQFAIRNVAGQSLGRTSTHEFRTRLDSDPALFTDPVPGAGPMVVSTSPANGDAAVAVAPGNRVEIVLSENVDPCTINPTNVFFHIYELGDPAVSVPSGSGTNSGFAVGADISDQTPADPFTWGAAGTTPLAPPQRLPANIVVMQDFTSTRLIITPLQGFNPDPAKSAPLFPENALIVVQLMFGITDFGGLPMTSQTFAFTTENLPLQNSTYLLDSAGETPYDDAATTADVDSSRAPNRIQGFLLFSGDADNGSNLLSPSSPETVASGCVDPLQPNDGIKDVFDPVADVLLDTGSTVNTCTNSTDGSTAVVWEFQTLRIRAGITVRIIGVNPAIILVEGDATIDDGGRLLASGDGQGGAPQSKGTQGRDVASNSDGVTLGGRGVAGGADGGDATRVENNNQTWKYGHDGLAGFGSPDYDPLMPQVDPMATTTPPTGGGEGGAPVGITTSSPWDGTSSAGGGGGHATVGLDGDAPNNGTNWQLKLPVRSKGGLTYEVDATGTLPTPEAGSGGGAAGHAKDQPWRSSTSEGSGGGSGGAGGGFIDITSNGNISIFGTLDASGGNGGNGQRWNGSGDRGITGGGGGGSGGGIRLLTPNDIVLTATTVITAAGGSGGVGARHSVTRAGIIKEDNDGGNGGNGRLVFEDNNSIIAGLPAANVTPSEGQEGFYRGVFNPNRFQGGGLSPQATTDIFAVGPLNPTFVVPVQADFIAALPAAGAPGVGNTGIFIEMRGYQMAVDGTPDLATQTDWFSIGYFRDVAVENQPVWVLGHPGDITVPSDNALDAASPNGDSGSGMGALNASGAGGFEYIQVRVSIVLAPNVSVQDPGGILDDWIIRYTADN